LDDLGKLIRKSIRPEDIKPEYRVEGKPTAGACYVASEAYYHLMGGSESGLHPVQMEHEGSSHWWLEDDDRNVTDLTHDQFGTLVPYSEGKRKGFLTKQPSKRAQGIMDRLDSGSLD
jgi:hypothetical protein